MRDLFVTGVIFTWLMFVFRRPYQGVYLFTWISLMNPHRLCWGFAFNFPFAFIVAVVTILSYVASREPKQVPWSREMRVLLIFNFWIVVCTYFAFYPQLAWPAWNTIWKIQLFVFLTAMLINDRKKLDGYLWVLGLSLAFYGVKGGIFTIVHGGVYRVQGPDGTFIGGNNELGLALILTIPILRYLQLQARQAWVRYGLVGVMILTAIAVIGTQSRGAFLGAVAMATFFWLKSRNKFSSALYIIIAVAVIGSIMPAAWYERMETIKHYQTDQSAQGRINAWWTAYYVANANLTGGGPEMFKPPTFRQYAPEPYNVHAAHSIYFETLGETGYPGLAMYLLLGLFTWGTCSRIIRACKRDPERKWAADLAGMVQVSYVGFATGGAFLSLAFYDYPYDLLVVAVVTASLAGVIKPYARVGAQPAVGSSPSPAGPAGQWHHPAGRTKDAGRA